jgi:hypothetical protein
MERLGGAVDENNVSLKRISHPGAPVNFSGLVCFAPTPPSNQNAGPVG